jgi:hypothetical protein
VPLSDILIMNAAQSLVGVLLFGVTRKVEIRVTKGGTENGESEGIYVMIPSGL